MATTTAPPHHHLEETDDKVATREAHSSRSDDHTHSQQLTEYEVQPCRCNCQFCIHCAKKLSINERFRLSKVLETFTHITMVTLTVDPDLFTTPPEAYAYLRDHKCVHDTIRTLIRRNRLYSRRYFCVLEWQRNTEQVHYHILLDIGDLTEAEVYEIWSRRRPQSAGPAAPGRPRFGVVYVKAAEDLEGYDPPVSKAASYVTKLPDCFPKWVLDMGADKRVKRFSTSQGFYGRPLQPPRIEPMGRRRTRQERKRLTYAQRTAECGTKLDVFEPATRTDYTTGEVVTFRKYAITIAAKDAGQPGTPAFAPVKGKVVAQSPEGVLDHCEAAAGQPLEIQRTRRAKHRGD
jgi:hypothetical protein